MNQKTRKTLTSSATDEWSTPQELFDKWDSEYHFDLDVCANFDNAKCERFFTKEQDGLLQEWTGNCWMNPTYGRGIGRWVRKAYQSAESGKATVVCLIPSRTDTSWFHDYVLKGEMHFIRRRIRFGGSNFDAPFPSMVVVFKAKEETKCG